MPSCGSLTVGTRLPTTADLESALSDPAARFSAMSKRRLDKDLNSDQSCIFPPLFFHFFAGLTLNYLKSLMEDGYHVSHIFWKAFL